MPLNFQYDPNDLREQERRAEMKTYCKICGNETTGGHVCAFCWDEYPRPPKPQATGEVK